MADPREPLHGPGDGDPAGRGPASRGPEEAHIGEDRELRYHRIVGFGGGIAALLVAAAIVCFLLLQSLTRRLVEADPPPPPIPEARARELPPEPRLQESPVRDMAELDARQRALLESYGWVDRQKGVVRIPIDRGIELMATRGLRAAPPETTPDGGTPGTTPDGGAP